MPKQQRKILFRCSGYQWGYTHHPLPIHQHSQCGSCYAATVEYSTARGL